mmetsp:Transcript_35827/g.74530  ORF Transcript_35827/g.74530 Transcript_35827/m.74530 type:complete len:204 (+) Transcript_35827:41-652(+)
MSIVGSARAHCMVLRITAGRVLSSVPSCCCGSRIISLVLYSIFLILRIKIWKDLIRHLFYSQIPHVRRQISPAVAPQNTSRAAILWRCSHAQVRCCPPMIRKVWGKSRQDSVGLLLGNDEGAVVIVGAGDGCCEGRWEGATDGVSDGFSDGDVEGLVVGSCDGCSDGRCEGAKDGVLVGLRLGEADGAIVGVSVGDIDGIVLG